MKKLIAGIMALALGYATGAHAANLWELRDGSNVTQVNITDAATPVIEQADLAGNASTASALAADPADCSANQYANAIAASGALSCGSIVDADIPNSITIDLAATATALAANGTNCSANQFNKGVDASGNAESCAALLDADIPNSITVDLAATATALAADPADCGDGFYALGVNASGVAECSAVATAAASASTAAVSAGALFTHDADADAHHAESHTIASHSDTTATGAELETLTDGSNADSLHVHASAVPEFEGRKTTAAICADTPTQAGNFSISSDDFDLYTSTGTGVGDWRNSRTGVGPC